MIEMKPESNLQYGCPQASLNASIAKTEQKIVEVKVKIDEERLKLE
jgi:hypothetical protein